MNDKLKGQMYQLFKNNGWESSMDNDIIPDDFRIFESPILGVKNIGETKAQFVLPTKTITIENTNIFCLINGAAECQEVTAYLREDDRIPDNEKIILTGTKEEIRTLLKSAGFNL
jgi:hypothetical protein